MTQTTLHHHVELGDLAHVDAILTSGASINEYSASGLTPLGLAVLNQQSDIAKYLLEQGADKQLGFTAAGRTEQHESTSTLPEVASPLHIAAARGWAPGVRLLIEHGADPNDDSDLSGSSQLVPLHVATGDAVAPLIELGGDVSRKNQYGWTPLVYAISRGDTAAVRLLAENGAEVDFERTTRYKVRVGKPGADGTIPQQLVQGTSSPLMNCTGHGRVNATTAEMISILAAHGADINRRYFASVGDGETRPSFTVLSLILGSRAPEPTVISPHAEGDCYGEKEVAAIQALLAAGANVNEPPVVGYLTQGRLPFLDFEARLEVLQMLLTRGAKLYTETGISPQAELVEALKKANKPDVQVCKQFGQLAATMRKAAATWEFIRADPHQTMLDQFEAELHGLEKQ